VQPIIPYKIGAMLTKLFVMVRENMLEMKMVMAFVKFMPYFPYLPKTPIELGMLCCILKNKLYSGVLTSKNLVITLNLVALSHKLCDIHPVSHHIDRFLPLHLDYEDSLCLSGVKC